MYPVISKFPETDNKLEFIRNDPNTLGCNDDYWSADGITEMYRQCEFGSWAPNAKITFIKKDDDVWASVTLFGKYDPKIAPLNQQAYRET